MRRNLRILAAAVAVLTLGLWVVTGAHTGWTKTSKVVMKTDPVTELEYPDSQKTFVAGVEVVGGGLLLSGLLAGGSLLFPTKKPSKT